MKFLLDNNLSYRLIQSIEPFFPHSSHVGSVLSNTVDDRIIWEFAKSNGFTILTKDNDFDEMSQLFGCPPKVVHLVCGNKNTSQILTLIITNANALKSFLQNDKGKLPSKNSLTIVARKNISL